MQGKAPETVSSPLQTTQTEPVPVSEPERAQEPTPERTPEPTSAAQEPVPASARGSAPELVEPEPKVPEASPGSTSEPVAEPAVGAPSETNTDLIDFNTMKYFPTDMTHKVVRKTLLAGGITTKSQLLELLGTTTPNRTDWEIFIKKLSIIANDAGFKFFSSSDGTLYWWLTKRMKWIKPFSGTP